MFARRNGDRPRASARRVDDRRQTGHTVFWLVRCTSPVYSATTPRVSPTPMKVGGWRAARSRPGRNEQSGSSPEGPGRRVEIRTLCSPEAGPCAVTNYGVRHQPEVKGHATDRHIRPSPRRTAKPFQHTPIRGMDDMSELHDEAADIRPSTPGVNVQVVGWTTPGLATAADRGPSCLWSMTGRSACRCWSAVDL